MKKTVNRNSIPIAINAKRHFIPKTSGWQLAVNIFLVVIILVGIGVIIN